MDNELLQEKLIEYLESNNLKYIIRDNKISHNCLDFVNHQDTSPSAFTILSDESFSHCSSCGFHLNTENLYKLLELGLDKSMLFKSQIMTMLKKLEKSSDKKEQAPIYLPIFENDFDKPYRGISSETYKKVGAFSTIPDTYYARRIIFPIYDVDSKLRGFEAISTNKKIVPKVLRPRGIETDDLFGFEHLINSDTVFICEGLFSALSFIECGYNGIFNFGVGSIKGKIKKLMMKGVKNVFLVGDNDEAGKKFNIECYHFLKHNFKVCYFNFPFGSADKYDGNDLLKERDSAGFKEYAVKMLIKNLIKVKE